MESDDSHSYYEWKLTVLPVHVLVRFYKLSGIWRRVGEVMRAFLFLLNIVEKICICLCFCLVFFVFFFFSP